MPAFFAQTRLCSFPELETPLGRVHFGGYLPNSNGTGLNGFRHYGMYAAVLLLRGAGVYRDANNHEYGLGRGSLIMVFPEIAHHYGPQSGQRWDEVFVAFSGAAFDAWRAHGLDPLLPVWNLENPEEESTLFRSLLEKEVSGLEGALSIAIDVHKMLGRWLKQKPKTPGLPAWIERARRILATPQDQRSLRSIAAECGLHVDAFRKAFGRWTGETPSQFRRRHRLSIAATLLRHQNLTLAQVAETLGFHDAFHFSKRFKEQFGVSPSLYRKRPPTPVGEIIRGVAEV